VPTDPLNVMTANNVGATTVRVSWDQPLNTGGTGISIEAYKVLLKKQDGTFIEDTTVCDGSTLVVVTNRYCDIEMSTFTGSTFNLI
jgi:hypothetical protein